MKEKESLTGIVEQVKLVKAQDPALVYIKLKTDQKVVHAIRALDALTFMMEVIEGDELSVYGYYNTHKQFVIQKYMHRHQAPRPESLPPHLSYPSQKKYS